MMRKLMVLGVAVMALVVGATACQPTEPAMEIRVTMVEVVRTPGCAISETVPGDVIPHDATPKVVLQRTSGGKWVDWSWFTDSDDTTKGLITATPDAHGVFEVHYMVPRTAGTTYHLRLRSNGGTHFSDGFYITPKEWGTGGAGPFCVT